MCNGKTAEMIRARLQELEAEREELQTALRVLERFATGGMGTTVPSSEPDPYPGVDINFIGANNLLERLIRIAEAVDGPLEAVDMALCLIQRGVSNASRRNLRSHIINALRDDPDFAKVAPGRYEYLPKAQSGQGVVTPGTTK